MRRASGFDGISAGLATLTGLGIGAERGRDEIFFFQRVVHGHAVVFVLRGDGAATDQVAGFVPGGVDGDAFPKGVQHHDVAEVHVDAGAAKFEHLFSNGIIDGKIEDLVAVVAEILAGDFAGLQAIGADQPAGIEVRNHQVVAEIVEGVDIEVVALGSGQAFAQFLVEDGVTQALAVGKMVSRLGKTDSK